MDKIMEWVDFDERPPTYHLLQDILIYNGLGNIY